MDLQFSFEQKINITAQKLAKMEEFDFLLIFEKKNHVFFKIQLNPATSFNTQSNPAWESSFSTSDQDLDLTGLRFCQGSIDVQTLILDEQSISRRIFDILQFLVDA